MMVHLNSSMVEHLLPGVVKLPLPGVVRKSLLCQADRFLKKFKKKYSKGFPFQLSMTRTFNHLCSCVDTSSPLELNCSLLTVSLSFHSQLQGLIVGTSLLYVRSNSLGQGLRKRNVRSGGTEAVSTFRWWVESESNERKTVLASSSWISSLLISSVQLLSFSSSCWTLGSSSSSSTPPGGAALGLARSTTYLIE